jgi:hypothetical protein
VFREAVILGHLEYFVPFSTDCTVCNGHGNHSVNVKDEGSQLVDIRMVGGIVYHNISLD